MKTFISFVFFLTIGVGYSFAGSTPCSQSKIASLQNQEFIQRFVGRYPLNVCKLIDLYDPSTKVVQCRGNLKAISSGTSIQIVDCNAARTSSNENPQHEYREINSCPCELTKVYVDGDGIINDYEYTVCPCEGLDDPSSNEYFRSIAPNMDPMLR